MPFEEVVTLQEELKAWILDMRPELKDKLEELEKKQVKCVQNEELVVAVQSTNHWDV